MLAWLVIGASIGWALGSRNGRSLRPETVLAVALGLVGAILGGLAADLVVEGQLDLEWQPSGAVGAALGTLLLLLWLRPFSRWLSRAPAAAINVRRESERGEQQIAAARTQSGTEPQRPSVASRAPSGEATGQPIEPWGSREAEHIRMRGRGRSGLGKPGRDGRVGEGHERAAPAAPGSAEDTTGRRVGPSAMRLALTPPRSATRNPCACAVTLKRRCDGEIEDQTGPIHQCRDQRRGDHRRFDPQSPQQQAQHRGHSHRPDADRGGGKVDWAA
jgi:uncharacterized membrane protein YeaQ/YmgE (transglycosylase-associated protein family)